MAERSYLWPTTGTGDGPSGGYPYTQVAELLEGLYPTGVLWGLSTSVSGFNVTVSPGKAIIQGIAYANDAPVTFTIANPGSGNTRRDLIVLRGNANTRTIRLAIKQGALNSTTYPALQQDGTFPASGVFEIQAARLLASSTGVTLDGGPQMTVPRGLVQGSQIVDGAITAPKISDGAVSTAKIQDGAVTLPKIAASALAAADRRWGGSGWVTETSPQRIARGQIGFSMSAGQTNTLVTVGLSGVFAPASLLFAYAQVLTPSSGDLVWVSEHSWWDTTNNIYGFTVRRSSTNAASYTLSFMLIGQA